MARSTTYRIRFFTDREHASMVEIVVDARTPRIAVRQAADYLRQFDRGLRRVGLCQTDDHPVLRSWPRTYSDCRTETFGLAGIDRY